MSADPKGEFEKAASGDYETNLFWEFWHFLRTNKKWWLVPIILVLLMLGVVLVLAGSSAAPFIYTLF